MNRNLWVDRGQKERRKEREGEPGAIVGGWSLFRKMVIAGSGARGFLRMSNPQF